MCPGDGEEVFYYSLVAETRTTLAAFAITSLVWPAMIRQ